MAITDRRGVIVNATDPAVQSDPNPGIAIKAPVLVATTANITLSGLQTVDGVALVANNRVLVKNQATASQNGIYVASTGNWMRALDLQGNSQIAHGTTVFVTTGTTQTNTQWVVTTNDPITVGTTAINWAQQQLSISAFGAIQSAMAGTFVTVSSQAALLPNSRSFTASAPLTVTDGGAGGVLTVGLPTPLSQANGGTGLTSFSNLNNARLAKTTGYTVANADKGKTIALGGSAYYTLTVNAASGYDSDFQVRILNEDTARGKLIAINGITSFVLYPLQSLVLFNQNNVWQIDPSASRYIARSLQLFVDSISGSDSNDGFVAGAGGAWLTLTHAWSWIRQYLDAAGGGPNINLATGTYSVANVILSGQPPGAYIVSITGNASSPGSYLVSTTQSSQGIQIVDYGCIIWTGVEFAGNSGSTLFFMHQHSIADFANCIWGSNVDGTGIDLENTGRVNFTGQNQFNGNCAQFLALAAGGTAEFGGTNYSCPAAMTFTQFALVQGSGAHLAIDPGATFTGTGSAGGSTGKKYTATFNATVFLNSVTLPGASAGTSASGAQTSA